MIKVIKNWPLTTLVVVFAMVQATILYIGRLYL